MNYLRTKSQNPLLPALLLLVFWLFSVPVKAQRYPFFNLSVESGLVQSQPRALLQDSSGHLWIGTLGGLSRYDGQHFVNYTVRDGLPSNNLRALATDKNGNIWIGSSNGLTMFNGKKFTSWLDSRDENANPVTEVCVTETNRLWFIAGNRVFSLKENKPFLLDLPDPEAVATSLLCDKDNLWIATAGGRMYRFSENRFDSLFLPPNQSNQIPNILKIFKDRQQKIWLGTSSGLYVLDSGSVRPAPSRNQRMDLLPPVFSIAEDHSGALWLGTNNGAIRYAHGTVQFFNKRSGLSDNPFFAMLRDKEGNIWMASDGQGVFRYSGAQFTVLDEASGLTGGQVMSIESDGSERMFFGTYDAGLFVFENGTVNPISLPLKNAPAITALSYRNGSLWMGTRGAGLWRWNGTYFYHYPAEKGKIPSNYITTLFKDHSNRLWIGSMNGATVIDKDSIKKLSLNKTAVQAFIQLGKDSILMATSAGIQLYSEGNIYKFITGSILDSAEAQCFAIKGHELWTGTNDNGIIVYNFHNGNARVINRSNGLQSDFIYNIINDDRGNVWAGTGYGIHRIRIDKNGGTTVLFFGKGQGIRGMESNHNAVLKTKDGSIWFGTTNGALHYLPNTNTIIARPANIVLQSVKISGEEKIPSDWYDSTGAWYSVPYGLQLPYKKNSISFTFQGISLSSSEQLRYRYKMEGLDNTWSEWSPSNTITFSALPPGKYRFVVQCNTEASTEGVRQLSYSFTIITPFHKTTWFRLAAFGICILIGVSIQYIANKRKQNRLVLIEKLRTEEQNKVRQRTAEDFHDEVGNRLTRINVLTNVLKNKIGNLSPDSERIIHQIQDNTAQLYSGTRDILWSLKPSNDSLKEILNRISEFGIELYQDTDVDFHFKLHEAAWEKYKLPMDVSRNLIMIFKEALNNCLKYSHATEVKLEVFLREKDIIQLILSDNGKGFDLHYVKRGHGIDNMHVRAGRIKGRLYIDSGKEKGTIITLTFRLPEEGGKESLFKGSARYR